MKSSVEIINEDNSSYNDKKKILVGNMKKKKDDDQYRIVREYKNVFSCNELIERIIRFHMDERNLVVMM